jgi:Spy/CpxP family protein refolding chaperone
MKALKNLLCVALVLAISSGALAADEAKKGKGEAKKGKRPAPSVTARFLGDIELTAEQKEKVAAIDKEFAAKAADIRKKTESILTEDQIKARAEAQKAARAAGSKGADAQKAVNAALKLTEEQKTQMADVQKANRELSGQVVAALKKVLTEEQAAKLKAPAARGNAKKGNAKKPAAKAKKKPE